MKFLQWFFILIGGYLQLMVIASMVRSSYRNFPVLFTYVVASFLAAVVEMAVFLDLMNWSAVTHNYYWVSEGILQLLVFLLVLSLIYRAMEGQPSRPSLMRLLAFGALAIISISYIANWGGPVNSSMTMVFRNMSFAAVVLNLILWFMLIRHRGNDPRVLMISGGLGVQMAGEAIAHSLRRLAIPHRSLGMVFAGNLVLLTSHLLALYIWWQTLRRPAPDPPAPESRRFDPARGNR